MTITDTDCDCYLETLRRLVMELGPQRSFQSSLRVLLRILAERHAFLRPHLVIFDPQTRALRLCLTDTPPTADGVVYEPGVGITGQVFTLGKPVIVERICENGVFQNKFFTRTPQEMRELAFLSVPVLGPGEDPSEGLEVLGVLSTDTPVASRARLEERCRFLEVIAAIISNQMGYLQRDLVRQWPGDAHREDATAQKAQPMVAASKSMRHALALAVQAAASRSPVLLWGEAGTGKERLASVLHTSGPRRDMPLLYCHCGELAPAAMEEVLFGVQKGAAPHVLQTHKGILEQAHLGMVYLQEVESLPEDLQMRLFRAMQDRELRRKGGSQVVEVDVRFIYATHRTLEQLRDEGQLCPELLACLGGWAIYLPPLRERTEDILPLAEAFLREAATAIGKDIRRISMTAIDLLLRYPWPGNAHELKHCMESAASECEGDAILAWHLPPSLQEKTAADAERVNFCDAVARFEQELLMDALRKAEGNMLEASRILGVSYRIVNYKVKKYGLSHRKIGGRE